MPHCCIILIILIKVDPRKCTLHIFGPVSLHLWVCSPRSLHPQSPAVLPVVHWSSLKFPGGFCGGPGGFCHSHGPWDHGFDKMIDHHFAISGSALYQPATSCARSPYRSYGVTLSLLVAKIYKMWAIDPLKIARILSSQWTVASFFWVHHSGRIPLNNWMSTLR